MRVSTGWVRLPCMRLKLRLKGRGEGAYRAIMTAVSSDFYLVWLALVGC